MRTALRVKIEDCKTARYASTSDCPIARALKRILKDGCSILVGPHDVWVRYLNYGRITILLNHSKFNHRIMELAKEDIILTLEIPDYLIDMDKLDKQWVREPEPVQTKKGWKFRLNQLKFWSKA